MKRLIKLLIALALPMAWLTLIYWLPFCLAEEGRQKMAEGLQNLEPRTLHLYMVGGTIALLGYLLPSLLSACRNHQRFGAIFTLNLLMGWTQAGWVAAFIWAWASPKPQQTFVTNNTLVIEGDPQEINLESLKSRRAIKLLDPSKARECITNS